MDRTLDLCNAHAQQWIPWIVFDRDQVKDFDGIIEKASQNEINAGWSNPCFEIWMYAYFGEMPNIHDSATCCSRFADRFQKETGQPYEKNDKDIYRRLTDHGDLETTFQLAERNLKLATENQKKPSESFAVCTVHQLVKEIMDKVQSQR